MSDSTGWIRLYRSLLDSQLWMDSNSNQKAVIITLLLMANSKPATWKYKGQTYDLQPGMFITSIGHIAQKAGVSKSCAARTLTALQAANFATYTPIRLPTRLPEREPTRQPTHLGIAVNIVKWAFFQGEAAGTDTPTDTPTDTEKIREPDTNKNRDYKRERSLSSLPPSLTEIQEEIKKEGYQVDANRFVETYDSNGWTANGQQIRDWRALLRRWDRNARQQPKPARKVEREAAQGGPNLSAAERMLRKAGIQGGVPGKQGG